MSESEAASHQAPIESAIDEAFYRLQTLNTQLNNYGDQATLQINLLKTGKFPDSEKLRKVPLRDTANQTARRELLDSLTDLVHTTVGDPTALSDFDFEDISQEGLSVLRLDVFEHVKQWFDNLPSAASISEFDQSYNFLSKVKCLVYYLDVPGLSEPICCFKYWTQAKLMRSGGRQLVALHNDYDFISNQRVLTIDLGVDFFLYDNLIFINKYENFEKLLQFRKITEETAESALDDIFKQLPVTNPEDLKAALSLGVRSMKKIAKTKGKEHVPKLDPTSVSQLIEHENLNLKMVNGKLDIDPNDQKQLRDFIYVVNDAFVQSIMTRLKYIAFSAALRPTPKGEEE